MPHPLPLVLLLLLLQFQLVAVSSHPPWAAGTFTNHTTILPIRCLPDQASALLQLKHSFIATNKSVTAFQSWKAGTDCCRWEGIRCGPTSGRVTSLDLGDCGLESDHLDHVLFELTSLRASRNHLSGNIPPTFCGTKLQILDLSSNNLNGSIPSCLMEDANALEVLNLKENKLYGELPHNINESCMFEALDFSNNQIEGRLPRSITSCKYLEVLNIGNNQIRDSFPCWMTALPRLQVLVLKSNKLFGQVSPSIEKSTCEFPSLRILDLSSNNFSGTLTEEWFIRLKSMKVEAASKASVMEYNGYQSPVYQVNTMLTYKGSNMVFSKILTTLVFIDVSNNAIHGSIPGAIGELVLLQVLNMSHNSFTGPIPSQFGCLNQLESLDLSSNGISGEIPQEISSLDFLTTLNLSNNMLEGRIPESRHFSTFDDSSFMGNTGLCGPPLSKQCNNETTPNLALHNSEEKSIDVMLFLFVGLGFGVGFAVAIVVIWVLPLRKNHE